MAGVTGFFMVLVVVGIVFALAYGVSDKNRTNEAYSQVARDYEGRCEHGGWFDQPKIEFSHGDAWVVVDVSNSSASGGNNSTYYTQIHFYGPQPPVRCEVYPEGAWSRLKKLFGMQDIVIGARDFDEQYIIQGEDGPPLRDLLHHGVRKQIDELRRLLDNNNIYVSFNANEMLVKKLSYIKYYIPLKRLVELSIMLYDEAIVAVDDGIEIIKDAPSPKLQEAVCQICGDRIKSAAVFCRRCQTPHHEECWEYYGACSTYGCLETNYLRPTSRRARRGQKTMRR